MVIYGHHAWGLPGNFPPAHPAPERCHKKEFKIAHPHRERMSEVRANVLFLGRGPKIEEGKLSRIGKGREPFSSVKVIEGWEFGI